LRRKARPADSVLSQDENERDELAALAAARAALALARGGSVSFAHG
jgi:hypothetical protein